MGGGESGVFKQVLSGEGAAEGCPFLLGIAGEEEPTIFGPVHAVEGMDAEEVGVREPAGGFAGELDVVVRIYEETGADHGGFNVLALAGPFLDVEGHQQGNGDDHGGADVGVGFVGDGEGLGYSAGLLVGEIGVGGRGGAATRLVEGTTRYGSRNGVHDRAVGVRPL